MTKNLPTVPIKGKNYVTVNTRIIAFREEHPNWGINTEIIHMAEGVVFMKATITNENGFVIGTGHAYEKESSSFINKTSYVENCETSAVGRAIANACAIGIEDSFASADEVANAQLNQMSPKKKAMIDHVEALLEATKTDKAKTLKYYKAESLEDLAENELGQLIATLDKRQQDSFKEVVNK